MNAKHFFTCGECYEEYPEEEDARECCRPTVKELWRCGSCNKDHEDEKEAADCCTDEAGEPIITPKVWAERMAELENAGQLRLMD